MTAFANENRRHVESAELNRRLSACPEPTAKRKIWLVLCGVAVTVAGVAALAILAGVLRHIPSLP